MTLKSITASDLLAIRNDGKPVDLIDVPTPIEYREIHAEGVRLAPLDRLNPKAVMSSRNGNSVGPLYVICRSGSRARQACEKFAAAGFPNVILVEDGTPGWETAGGPVVRGKNAISLERQVRITAGFLVLLATVLTLTVDLWFVLLAATIGAGLVFSGITDTCGMGMVLARMPWNQVRDESQTCCAH